MSETGELAKALTAFQAEMPTVAKSKKATVKSDKGSYSYTYAGLAEVTHAALPILSKHGLAFVCIPEIHERGPVLTGVLLHTSGETLRGSLPIATSGTPQQTGSAITYARRYLFGAMTGLVTEDDDDGQLAARKPPEKKAERVKTTSESDPFYDTPPRESGDRQVGKEQLVKMHASFSDLGITDRDKRLLYANDVLGLSDDKALTTSNDLTRSQASKVINALAKDAEQPFPQEEPA